MLIESKDGDAWSMQAIARQGRDILFGIYDSARQLLTTLGEKAGVLVSEAKAPGEVPLTGVGAAPAVWAAVSIAVMVVIWKALDYATTLNENAIEAARIECVRTGKCPPEIAQRQPDRSWFDSVFGASNETSTALSSTAQIIKWAAISGAAVYALRTLGSLRSERA